MRLSPNVKWGQSQHSVVLTFEFAADFSGQNESSSVDITDNYVSLNNSKYALAFSLLHPVDGANPKVFDTGRSVRLVLTKRMPEPWPKLTEDQIPTLSVDWSHWLEDGNNEETPPSIDEVVESMKLPSNIALDAEGQLDVASITDDQLKLREVQAVLSENIRFSEADAKPLDSAPDLSVESCTWLDFFLDNMSLPQRMFSLVMMWNKLDGTRRQDVLNVLTQLLPSQELSKEIVNNAAVFKDLDPSFYASHGVTVVPHWPRQIAELSATDCVSIFSLLFERLPTMDRKLVLTTFL